MTLECKNNAADKKYNIKKTTKKSFTEVYFEPDFNEFEGNEITKEYIELISNRMLHLSQQLDIQFELKYSNVDDLEEELF